MTKNKLTSFEIPEKNFIDKVSQILEFLKEHYTIKVNEFDQSKILIFSKTKEYKFPVTLKTIYIHLMSENINISKSFLSELLSDPNYIECFNPINEYFDNLKNRKIKKESQIDKLCTFFIAKDFNDKINFYYQKRLNYLLKKWLVCAIANLKGTYANEVAIGFIKAGGGDGKTYFFENFLIPKELKEYYVKSTTEKKNFNLVESFIKNFVVNFDELVGLNTRNNEEFKSLISSNEILFKPFRETYARKFKRNANIVFTSNKTQENGGFLQPCYSLRRFACIEIENINQSYSRENLIDINDIWSEALFLYENEILLSENEQSYKWNQNDFDEFTEYNQKYIIETPAVKLIKLYYDKPTNESDGVLKNATDILRDLNNKNKITSDIRNEISVEKIGTALKQLNFNETQKRIDPDRPKQPIKLYYVKQLF